MSGTSEKNNVKRQIDERSEDFDISAPVNLQWFSSYFQLFPS